LGFMRDRPVKAEEVGRRKIIGSDYRRTRNIYNHYFQDREAQKKVNFTGMTGDGLVADFLKHDACATESMGPIYDRSSEHLGVSDKAVIALRKLLLNEIKNLQDGQEPTHVVTDPAKNHFPHVDTIAEVIPAGEDWRQRFKHLTAVDL